jgi:hypothetical protein
MKVQVLDADIAYGCRMNTLECPVARAVSRATGMLASVHWNKIILFSNKKEAEMMDWHDRVVKEWDTPSEVVRMIRRFDEGLPVCPFEFEL